MKITRQQRYEYRDLLIEKGVPEEIAVIASERLTGTNWRASYRAHCLINAGFWWPSTPEGDDIWFGVFEEAEEVCK